MQINFKVSMFNDNVTVIIGDFKEMEVFCDKTMDYGDSVHIINRAVNASGFCTRMPHNGHLLVWFTDISDHLSMYHECLHSAIEILYEVGSPISYENQETIAYVQGFLANEIITRYEKKIKSLSKKVPKEGSEI